MSEPSFPQHEPRSLLFPALLALIFLALAFFVARHIFPSTTVDVDLLHTDTFAATTVYKTDSIVLGPPQTSHTFFVVTSIRVDNRRREQIFLDDFTLTLTDPTGAQLTVKGIQKLDLPGTELSFPNLKPLLVTPLLRDTAIDPGQSAEGSVVFPLTIPQSIWDTRRSADLQVDIYHGHPVVLTIPK